MKNDRKTKNELIAELESVNRKVKKLETLLEKRKHTEQNITESKRAEGALQEESEERFRIAAKTSNDAVYEWDIKQSVKWFGNIE